MSAPRALAGVLLSAIGLLLPVNASAANFGPVPPECKPGAAPGSCVYQTRLGTFSLSPHVVHVGDSLTADIVIHYKSCFQFNPCVTGVNWGGAPCNSKAYHCEFQLTQALADQWRSSTSRGWDLMTVGIGSGIGTGYSVDYFGVLAPGDYTDEASIGPHALPSVATALRSPSEVPLNPIDLARSALLAAALLVLVGFPGHLFNSTMQTHYDEITGWFRFLRRRQKKADLDLERAVTTIENELGLPETPRWAIAAVFLFGATAGSFIDPKFGFDLATLEGFIGSLGAVLFTTVAYTGISAIVLHQTEGRWGAFRIYPGNLVVVLFCMVISKVTTAQPGYLYGVLLGYTLGRHKIPREREGKLVAVGSAVVLAVSVATWVLWAPVKTAAEANPSLPLVALSALMASVFLGGMTSLLFGNLPISFMDGQKLFTWRKSAWAILFATALILFVHVVLNAAAGTAHPGRNYTVAGALFLAFGAFSVSFWGFFRFRPTALRTAPVKIP